MSKFNYKWTLKDAIFTKDKGSVFSCFACGGGSSFGYKLAGFDVIGCNEIDPKMMDVYKKNHNPKYSYLEPIQEFKNRDDLPKELYNLDILDGSPPCSSFSMAGVRERDWGVERKFREGQSEQVLDTLFFDFIDLAKKLQPKVVIAENVKGILMGKAIEYVREIYKQFDEAGYYCQHWLLDASKMGVPQRRERVFFICLRKDLAKDLLVNTSLFEVKPELKLEFNYKEIKLKEFADYNGRLIQQDTRVFYLWENRRYGDIDLSYSHVRMFNKKSMFNYSLLYKNKVCYTIPAKEVLLHYDKPMYLSKNEVIQASSFPLDYDFNNNKPHYICGMSVPPLMIANIASEVYKQWLTKIK